MVNFFLLLLLAGCFTPRLNKEILKTQEDIAAQRYQKAISRYEGILNSSPPKEIKAKIYYQLGELYSIQMLDYNKAIYYYNQVKDASDDSLWEVKAEEKMADINFMYTKNYKAAIKNYTHLFEFRPKLNQSDMYEYRLAMCFFYIGEMDKSIVIFEKILKNDKHQYNVKSFYHLGMIFFQSEKWQKAVYYWKDYIKKESRRDKVVQTRFLMANAYETMEQLKEAYNLYYSILGEYPHTEVLKSRLNAIYARRVSRKR